MKNLSLEVKRKLISAAQEIYDAWSPDEEGFDDVWGDGGICHHIAEVFHQILKEHKIRSRVIGSDEGITSEGIDHAWLVVENQFELDLPYSLYEEIKIIPSGWLQGQETWFKKPNVIFKVSDLKLTPLKKNPDEDIRSLWREIDANWDPALYQKYFRLRQRSDLQTQWKIVARWREPETGLLCQISQTPAMPKDYSAYVEPPPGWSGPTDEWALRRLDPWAEHYGELHHAPGRVWVGWNTAHDAPRMTMEEVIERTNRLARRILLTTNRCPNCQEIRETYYQNGLCASCSKDAEDRRQSLEYRLDESGRRNPLKVSDLKITPLKKNPDEDLRRLERSFQETGDLQTGYQLFVDLLRQGFSFNEIYERNEIYRREIFSCLLWDAFRGRPAGWTASVVKTIDQEVRRRNWARDQEEYIIYLPWLTRFAAPLFQVGWDVRIRGFERDRGTNLLPILFYRDDEQGAPYLVIRNILTSVGITFTHQVPLVSLQDIPRITHQVPLASLRDIPRILDELQDEARFQGLGVGGYRHNPIDDEVSSIQRALASDPENPLLQYRLRVALVRAGRGKEAGFQVGDLVAIRGKLWLNGVYDDHLIKGRIFEIDSYQTMSPYAKIDIETKIPKVDGLKFYEFLDRLTLLDPVVPRQNPEERIYREDEIKTVCLECGELVKGKPDAPIVSHGYCFPCGKKILEKLKESRPRPPERNPSQTLLEAFQSTVSGWLAKPPIISVNQWIKGKEGEIYVRYTHPWSQLDLATFEIKPKYQKSHVAYHLIEAAAQLPCQTVKIENILVPEWAEKVKTYQFPGRETVVELDGFGVTVKFVKI